MRASIRTLFVLLATLFLQVTVAATAQQPDILIYKGKPYDLFSNPLEYFYKNKNDRPHFRVQPNVISTGNWRGYVATWKIQNDLLYLVKIDAWICPDFNESSCRKVTLPRLFSKRYRDGKVLADWFSGSLRMPDGKMIQYVHMGYGSVYEREITLEVKSGKVVAESTVDNTTRTLPSELELQLQELEKMNPEPRHGSTVAKQTPNQSDADSQGMIVAGIGWGKIAIGNKRTIAESVLGPGVNRQNFDDVYFYDYPTKGIQVSYLNKEDAIHAVFFYNKQLRYEHFVMAPVKTAKGVDWNSSPEDVIKAYGRPVEDYSRNGWRRMVFDGIDFRFENGILVRIAIPGK